MNLSPPTVTQPAKPIVTLAAAQQVVDDLWTQHGIDSSEWGGGASVTPIPGTSAVAWGTNGYNYLVKQGDAPIGASDLRAVSDDTIAAIMRHMGVDETKAAAETLTPAP